MTEALQRQIWIGNRQLVKAAAFANREILALSGAGLFSDNPTGIVKEIA